MVLELGALSLSHSSLVSDCGIGVVHAVDRERYEG